MRITSKGQVTIPLEMRERFGLRPYTEVEFVPHELILTVRPKEDPASRIARSLKAATGRATRKITTGEILRQTRGED
ncbi:MAG: AbrB/MazE/SpoVT family DNA-binding domain-containing protein [Verrucomicrobiae bacterium]